MKSILFKLSLNIIFVIIISSASNYLLAFQVDEYLTNDEADTTEEMNIAPTFIDIGFSGFSLDYKENVPERPDFISEKERADLFRAFALELVQIKSIHFSSRVLSII